MNKEPAIKDAEPVLCYKGAARGSMSNTVSYQVIMKLSAEKREFIPIEEWNKDFKDA